MRLPCAIPWFTGSAHSAAEVETVETAARGLPCRRPREADRGPAARAGKARRPIPVAPRSSANTGPIPRDDQMSETAHGRGRVRDGRALTPYLWPKPLQRGR